MTLKTDDTRADLDLDNILNVASFLVNECIVTSPYFQVIVFQKYVSSTKGGKML